MGDATHSTEGVAILEQLNLDYNRADQAGDAKRFSELLAEEFMVPTPVSPAIETSTSSSPSIPTCPNPVMFGRPRWAALRGVYADVLDPAGDVACA
jgi:hypothetical protein